MQVVTEHRHLLVEPERLGVDLILELEAGTAVALTERAAALDHEALDHAVEDQPVVERPLGFHVGRGIGENFFAFRERQKGRHRHRRLVVEQFSDDGA